jgi:gamma-glutamyltranspeptidase/glutathione hydrolase
MVTDGSRALMPFGVMGGEYQALGHAQLLTRFFDYGLDLQEAIDCARFFPEPATQEITLERGAPDALKGMLAKMGHRVSQTSRPLGGAQAIWIDWVEGILTGGSDGRKDGCAMGH